MQHDRYDRLMPPTTLRAADRRFIE